MNKMVFFLLLTICSLPGCMSSRQGNLRSDLDDYRGKTVEQLRQYAPSMEEAYDANSGVHYIWRLEKKNQGPPKVYYFVWRITPRDIGERKLDYVRVQTDSQGLIQSFEFVDKLPD